LPRYDRDPLVEQWLGAAIVALPVQCGGQLEQRRSRLRVGGPEQPAPEREYLAAQRARPGKVAHVVLDPRERLETRRDIRAVVAMDLAPQRERLLEERTRLVVFTQSSLEPADDVEQLRLQLRLSRELARLSEASRQKCTHADRIAKRLARRGRVEEPDHE